MINTDREQEIYDGTNEPSYTITDIVPINTAGEVLSQGTPIALMVDAPSGAFRGRAIRDDLEKTKSKLAGADARDCGEFTIPSNNNDAATQVSGCVTQALEDGVAFTADQPLGPVHSSHRGVRFDSNG